VQLGFGRKKPVRATKAEVGHAVKAGLEAAPAVLREFRLGTGETRPVDRRHRHGRRVRGRRPA
jgi:hypothetical protein